MPAETLVKPAHSPAYWLNYQGRYIGKDDIIAEVEAITTSQVLIPRSLLSGNFCPALYADEPEFQ